MVYNGEGNHGEDVKELYYYLDNVPSHYYIYFHINIRQLFPYEQLKNTNKNRSKQEVEFEILDTDVFKDNKYFDVFVKYTKITKIFLLK